jgi:hypothetical protein
MQIVINISKDDFEEICMQARMVEDTGSLFGRIRKAISHGTPLPKGHGRLIDADALGEKLHRYNEAPYQYALKVFNDAPTIIEAYKAESEDWE